MNSQFSKIIRITLGVMLVIFGVSMCLHVITMGTDREYVNFPGSINYIFPIVGILEIGIGALLLLKKWIAFGLILLAPIMFNILLFHIFLGIPELTIALFILLLNTMLIYKYWPQYRFLFY